MTDTYTPSPRSLKRAKEEEFFAMREILREECGIETCKTCKHAVVHCRNNHISMITMLTSNAESCAKWEKTTGKGGE